MGDIWGGGGSLAKGLQCTVQSLYHGFAGLILNSGFEADFP